MASAAGGEEMVSAAGEEEEMASVVGEEEMASAAGKEEEGGGRVWGYCSAIVLCSGRTEGFVMSSGSIDRERMCGFRMYLQRVQSIERVCGVSGYTFNRSGKEGVGGRQLCLITVPVYWKLFKKN